MVWSNVFSFTTQPPAGDDVDDNGILDDQEVDDGDDLDGDGTPDNDQDVEIKSFKAKEGNVKLGMRSSNSNLICVKALYTDSVDDYGNKPDQVLYGLWSYRVEVEQYGATATIKIFLSEPAPENSKLVFVSTVLMYLFSMIIMVFSSGSEPVPSIKIPFTNEKCVGNKSLFTISLQAFINSIIVKRNDEIIFNLFIKTPCRSIKYYRLQFILKATCV